MYYIRVHAYTMLNHARAVWLPVTAIVQSHCHCYEKTPHADSQLSIKGHYSLSSKDIQYLTRVFIVRGNSSVVRHSREESLIPDES